MGRQMNRVNASQSQLDFIRHLLAERVDPEAEMIRERLNRIIGSGRTLTRQGASEAIDKLNSIPVYRQTDVKPGYYAVVDPSNVTKFYRVKTGNGKWSGKTFVEVQAGEEFHPVKGRGPREAVLSAIAADPEAGTRYGVEIGRCYKCNRTLTDEQSRARGIGPECAAKMEG